MNERFLKSGSPTEKVEIPLPAGRYWGFIIAIEGTTAAGITFAEADLPFTRLMYDGDQYQGAPGDFYHNWMDLYGGARATFSGSANSAEYVEYLVPCGFPGQPNVHLVPNGDISHLSIDFGLDNADWDTNPTYTVYAKMQPGVLRSYDLFISRQNRNVSAAARDNFDLTGKNLAALYIRNPDSVIGEVTLELDGDTVIDSIDFDHLNAWTDYIRRVETSQNLAEYNAFERAGGQFRGAINQQASMDIEFTGAGDAEITKFQVRPNPERRPNGRNV